MDATKRQTSSAPDAFASGVAFDRRTLKRTCDATWIRVRGPGGQHRNRRETGVRLTHRATGITVLATERRSRSRNVSLAFERMAARLQDHFAVPAPRLATHKPAAIDARRLETKRQRGALKRSRRSLRWDGR